MICINSRHIHRSKPRRRWWWAQLFFKNNTVLPVKGGAGERRPVGSGSVRGVAAVTHHCRMARWSTAQLHLWWRREMTCCSVLQLIWHAYYAGNPTTSNTSLASKVAKLTLYSLALKPMRRTSSINKNRWGEILRRPRRELVSSFVERRVTVSALFQWIEQVANELPS